MTLADLPREDIEAWGRIGVTHVWLMGVWPTGPEARQHAVRVARAGRMESHASSDPMEEICGSPYAVAGYQVDPDLGGDASLARFRTALHASGLKLMLDFVPNHLALDHPWIRSHPNRFVGSNSRRPEAFRVSATGKGHWIAHGKDPFFPAWTDTAQLDWRLAEVHQTMFQELSSVAERCDGVRADMAMLILPEVFDRQWREWAPAEGARAHGSFWAQAIPQLKRRFPEFLTLAEAYWDLEPVLLSQGFDYAYDKRFYDHLISRRPSALRAHLLSSGTELWGRGARFLENHDEVRVASVASRAEQDSWAALLLALPGLRLVHEGQWEGRRARADIRTLKRQHEPTDESLRETYESLIRLSRTLGDWAHPPQLLAPDPAWPGNPSCDAFVAWIGLRGSGRPFLVAANLAHHEAQCVLRLPEAFGRAAQGWVDLLSGQRFPVGHPDHADPVLPLHLAAHQCVWLAMSNEQ